jgi:hypothetical protein
MNSEFIYQLISFPENDINKEQIINYIYVQSEAEIAFKAFFTFLRLRGFMQYIKEKNNIGVTQISQENRIIDIIFNYMNNLLKKNPNEIYLLIDVWLDNKDIQKISCLENMLIDMEYSVKKFTKSRYKQKFNNGYENYYAN